MVVVDFYAGDYGGAYGGDHVRHHQRDIAEQASLNYEEDTAQSHEQERRHGDAVGIARTDGVNGLWQITQYHAEGGKVSHDNYKCIHFDKFIFL